MDVSFSLAPVSHSDAFAIETPFVSVQNNASSARAVRLGRQPTPQAALTALEQTVVALAAFDHRRTVEPVGRFSQFLYSVFGGRPVTKLANERLDALRRFAVLYRYDGVDLARSERSAFLAAGFDRAAESEVRRLLDSIVTR